MTFCVVFELLLYLLFRFEMPLNPDLYEDLFYDVISVSNKSLTFLTRFMLSGRESFIGARQMVNKVDTVKLFYDKIDDMSIVPPLFCYTMEFSEVSC